MTVRDAVELFHLQFLRALCAGPDRELFTVKGGINLRFFFGSVRYSEDLDLDVAVTPKATLANKVDRILVSPLLISSLRSKDLVLKDISAPKQTDTTQRWKVGLEGPGVDARTKIEFSRRRGKPATTEAKVEAVDSQIARRHGVMSPLVAHYTLGTAIEQKVGALVGRTQVQARDLFDLHLLFLKAPGFAIGPSLRRAALERAIDISWGEFKAQVVAYLEPEQQKAWADKSQFEQMQLEVVARLEERPE